MEHKEYVQLMRSVSDFARRYGLETTNLYSDKNITNDDKWAISVSWKNRLSNNEILYSYIDEYKPDFDKKLKFPIVFGPREKIEEHMKMAEKKNADYFSKKAVSSDGHILPSPEFLDLSIVKKVEYALHEAFHNTPKLFFEEERDRISKWQYEEASAFFVGYLGAVHYFNEDGLRQQAIDHYQKNLNLGRSVNRFYNELDEILCFRVGKDGTQLSQEIIMAEREEVLERAKKELKDNLGGPINNAFFVYYHTFFEKIDDVYEKIKDSVDFGEIIQKIHSSYFSFQKK
ncbi:MAG: hypothetical protein JSV92_05215 [archaeon]|nr:MAG: hypothetical protein JSV92_05215 [archaeon]